MSLGSLGGSGGASSPPPPSLRPPATRTPPSRWEERITSSPPSWLGGEEFILSPPRAGALTVTTFADTLSTQECVELTIARVPLLSSAATSDVLM